MSQKRRRLAGLAIALATLVAVFVGAPAASATTATAFPFGSSYRVLVSPSGSGITPTSGWQNVDFPDESDWDVASAPFGNNAGCAFPPAASSFPENGTLYLRKHFTLPAGATNLHFDGTIDNDADIFVNGTLVGSAHDGLCGVGGIDMGVPDELLVAGDNVVAIRAADTGSVTFFDMEATYEQSAAAPATVTLLSAVPTGGGANVTGLVTGDPGPATIEFFTGATCGATAPAGTAVETVPAAGSTYFTEFVAAGSGSVLATANGGTQSNCIPIGLNNTSWPNAAPLSGSADGFISTPGESRWYKFHPGTDAQVNLTLSNLAANFDLAFFKDIAQAYSDLTAPDALTKLSAEFAGDAYSPSQFSPSQFSPSQFSADAYSPSQFSPDAYSPSQFSPSQFSPSQFSPSQFSPSQFSPSQFSAGAFSPSQFSPSQFSPSQFSPDAFSSAQTRSLIAVSALDGTADEAISANTWDNAGDVYVRVNGRNGAYSDTQPFHLTESTVSGASCAGVSPIGTAPGPAGGSYKTVILTDLARMTGTAAEKSELQTQLATLAARPEVAGVIVDLGADGRVAALNAQADAHKSCPYAKNLLARAIKDIVDSYRGGDQLQYVVIIGADDVVPFFRYPDATLLGNEKGYVPPVLDSSASQASLRLGYVLGQDGYGSSADVSIKGSTVPVPDLAVGRLVESPAEISGMLSAYLGTTGGVVPTPSTSLVTGYDFLADAANAVKDEFAAGTGGTPDTLITAADVSPLDSRSWTAAQLRIKLLGARHDLIYLAGHFSANSALAADFRTSLLTTDLDSSSVNLTNAIVFSAGCHSGYNIVDRDGVPGVTLPLDWAEAFAKKRATLIAGTGYQYGDTDFIEYSERLYLDFAKQLRAGTGAIRVGQALAQAKQEYLADTQLLEGLHQKAYIEATLFGLPMLGVDLPAGRGGSAGGGGSVVTSPALETTAPGSVLGLRFADLTFSPPLTVHTVTQANVDSPGQSVTATWLEGPSGIATSPLAPALPLDAEDVSVAGEVLRGVGFRSGSYTDSTVTPLTGAPTTEIRGVHSPFSSTTFYPGRPWTINYFDALANTGGATRLMLTPAQYRWTSPGSQTSTQRRYDSIGLRLYYSSNTETFGGSTPALSAPPSITDVNTQPGGGSADIRVHVTGNPAAGIQETWITYSDASANPGSWTSLDLTQDPFDSTLWTATLPLGSISPGQLRFFVQAVNGVGLVTLDDNNGAYYRVGGGSGGPPPQVTHLSLDSPPSTAVFGSRITVAAALTAGGSGVPGQVVTFAVGSQTALDVTDANGRAQVSMPLVVHAGSYDLRASFAGTEDYRQSSDESPLTVTKQPTSLSLAPPNALAGTGTTGGITATLQAGGEPLSERAVAFILDGPSGRASAIAITDFLGHALLPAVQLPAGTYSVSGYFAGTIPFPSGDQTFTDPAYLPSSATTATLTFTARGELQDVRADLNSFVPTASPEDATVLRGALKALDKALDPSLWSDGNHPLGVQVFQSTKEAVQKLTELAAQVTALLLSDQIEPWIDSLVQAGRDLATIAVGEASGGDPKKLADARDLLARAAALEATGPADALEQYKNAWQKARDAAS